MGSATKEKMKRTPAPKESPNATLQSIVWNVKALTRNEKLEGKEYLVVPMVMLTEGVHGGSSGPLYYPKEELEKLPVVWNHKPVVVYHPVKNGRPASACDPDVIEKSKVGIILNSIYEDGKLKAEAWLDVEKLRKVDKRVVDFIQSGQMVEVSTGVFKPTKKSKGFGMGNPIPLLLVIISQTILQSFQTRKGTARFVMGPGFYV